MEKRPNIHKGQSTTVITAATAIVLAIALVLPFVNSDYRIFQWVMVLSYIIVLSGLNLLTGYAGQISIGHGALFAIGSYTIAIAQFHFGIPVWLAVPLAGLVCFVFGYLFAWPIMRLEGIYLALATFSLALAIPQFLKVTALQPWTGGVSGVVLRMPQVPFGLPLSQIQFLYLIALAVAVLGYVVVWNLTRGDTGRALRAIRDHSLAASTLGVNLAGYKRMVFAISALFTGVGGALSALAVQFVGPDSFGIFVSISFMVGVVVGGLGSIVGPICGAIFIFFIPNITETLAEGASYLIYGAILILSIYFMPKGIAGLWEKASRRQRS